MNCLSIHVEPAKTCEKAEQAKNEENNRQNYNIYSKKCSLKTDFQVPSKNKEVKPQATDYTSTSIVMAETLDYAAASFHSAFAAAESSSPALSMINMVPLSSSTPVPVEADDNTSVQSPNKSCCNCALVTSI